MPAPLKAALDEMGFEAPTPIQERAIPCALTGRDLIACAQTGTGKTAAFGIPLLASLLKRRDRDALVLVPTRELAAQVAGVLEQLGAHAPELRVAMLIGGVSMRPQIKALQRKPRVLVATPGRLLDHLRGGTARLERVGMLVLDEADRMLDIGFAPQLDALLRFLPRERQTLMFSATLPPDIERLAGKYLRDPQRVQAGPVSKPVAAIEQEVRQLAQNEKNGALLDELNAREGTVLVFARTQHRTDRVARYLTSYGVAVERIHGGRSQGQRNRALGGFRDGTIRVLVATDIAARGIDIDHVAHVINFDLPQVAEDYVHRIGRTGRAGRSGRALSFVTPEDRQTWKEIERLVQGSKGSAANFARRENPTHVVKSGKHADSERSLPGATHRGGSAAHGALRGPDPRGRGLSGRRDEPRGELDGLDRPLQLPAGGDRHLLAGGGARVFGGRPR